MHQSLPWVCCSVRSYLILSSLIHDGSGMGTWRGVLPRLRDDDVVKWRMPPPEASEADFNDHSQGLEKPIVHLKI